MGRPTKLTDEVQEAICGHIRNGATFEVAAKAEGITGRSLLNWRSWGEESEEGTPHYELFRSTERARSQFETETLKRLATLDAEDVDPKIAGPLVKSLTWLLERTRRERYGTHITVKVEEAKDVMLSALESVCERLGTPEVFGALLEELDQGSSALEGEAGEGRAVH